MIGCQSIHEHSEFTASFIPSNKRQSYEVNKLKRFLKSAAGHGVGECLKQDLEPLKSFPRGHLDLRIFFILCKDCKQKRILPKCCFCGLSGWHINDAVLFYVAEHDKSYKTGKEIIKKYLQPNCNRE
jgi:hypothetical protein